MIWNKFDSRKFDIEAVGRGQRRRLGSKFDVFTPLSYDVQTCVKNGVSRFRFLEQLKQPSENDQI